MATALVTAVVINWRLQEATLRCLDSLTQLAPPCHIIVVDNGSGDGSADTIACHCPEVELLRLSANIGFGAACNLAIRRALADTACDFVLLLNNDATIDRRALACLLLAAQTCPDGGIFGPKIYEHNGASTIWYAGARRRRGVLAAAGTGRGEIDGGQFERQREVDYVFGAAMLVRRTVFERVGLFDERFFLYMEDLDLCLRAQAAGFKLVFVPQAHVHHIGSASTSSNRELRTYHQVKSTIAFLRKHTVPTMILPVLMFWLLVGLRALLRELTRGQFSVVQSYWFGLADGMIGVIGTRSL